jgi:hypothetical protein
VATFEDPVGPVVDEHDTELPLGSDTCQVIVPVGVAPEPVTDAVKVSLPPGETVELLSVTFTVGVAVGVNVPAAVKLPELSSAGAPSLNTYVPLSLTVHVPVLVSVTDEICDVQFPSTVGSFWHVPPETSAVMTPSIPSSVSGVTAWRSPLVMTPELFWIQFADQVPTYPIPIPAVTV